MSPKWFGTDGIRGQVGTFPLLPDFALRLGLATGQVLLHAASRPTVVIGRDTRQSGPMLQAALTAGLLAGGAAVVDVGIMTTPGVAYLVRQLGAQAGVVISASHNPVDQNGIKLFDAQGLKLPEALESEIEGLATDERLFETRLAGRLGQGVDGGGMQELYIEDLVREQAGVPFDRLSVVMDCANGAAYRLGPECFARLGARLVVTQAFPTGLNINAAAGSEHARRWPAELGQLVRQHAADFGLAFDGDADRVVLVDQAGHVVDGDHILGILAHYLDQRGRLLGRTIVATTMRNPGLLNFIASAGLNFVETQVGDKYVTEKLLELARQNPTPGAVGLGGEQAGHVILLDGQHAAGDGIRTALYVARALLESQAASLAELASCVEKTPQVIASASVEGKPALDGIEELAELEKAIQRAWPGVKINRRYSGTEPLFRVMLEAGAQYPEAELAAQARAMCLAVQKASGTRAGSIEILNCARGGLL